MTRLLRLALVGLSALAAGTVCAQVPSGGATTSPIRPDEVPEVVTVEDLAAPPPVRDSSLVDTGWTYFTPYATPPLTEAERTVFETVQREGVHVVHFWAPWCGNSRAEFETAWYEVVEAHPEVSFTFVTIWNDGDDGAATLARYGIPETATVLAQPDRGPSADRDARRRTFLGLPLSWTPSTWVFNRGGQLAYAFNYGEVSAERLEAAIEDARAGWEHD